MFAGHYMLGYGARSDSGMWATVKPQQSQVRAGGTP